MRWGCKKRGKKKGKRRSAARDDRRGLLSSEREARLHLVSCAVVSVALLVFFRVCYVQTSDHQRWLKLALRQHETSVTVEGARGDVYDARGRPLAVSIEARALGVHQRHVRDPRALIDQVSHQLHMPEKDLRAKLVDGKSFVWLARGVEQAEAEKVSHIEGIESFPEFHRSYPQGELARNILGRVSLEGKGQSGVELQFDNTLRADNRILPVRRDARGRAFMTSIAGAEPTLRDLVTPSIIHPAYAAEDLGEPSLLRKEGEPISLTIDSIVQAIFEEELETGLREAQARRVFGIVMDASTGEVLALGQRVRGGKVDAIEAMRNIPIQDSFEPGSTFKPLIAAAALEAGLVRPRELVNCENGSFEIAGHTIRDTHPVATVPFSEVLVRSSNIGMAKVGSRLGKDRFRGAIKTLGFGKETGVELPGEGHGLTKDGQRWGLIDVVTGSFGQGISVTALQLARAYAALANGGVLVQPTIVRASTHEGKRVFRPETAQTIATIIQGVTESEEGTGRNAAIAGLHVSGKTGTAQKPRANGRGYDPDKILASFIGFVDAHPIGVERKLVVFVAVDEPGVKPRWGGVVAAPIFRRALERTLSYLMANGASTNGTL